MKRAVVFAAALVMSLAWCGEAKTRVGQTFYTPQGKPANGQVTITATTTFTTAAGVTVPAGQRVVVPVKNGVFFAELEPNVGSTPSGTSYSVELSFGASATNEIWVVPDSTVQVTRDAIVATIVPTVNAQFSLSQIKQSGAAAGQAPLWNNVTKAWEPGAVGQVASVFGRTGTVTAQSGDYSGLYAALSHVHLIADTTGLQTILDGKAASSHAHVIDDTTGLQTTLSGKIGGAASITTLGRMLRATGAGTVEEVNDVTWDGVNKRFKVAGQFGSFFEIGRKTGSGPSRVHLDIQPPTDYQLYRLNFNTVTGAVASYVDYDGSNSAWSLNNFIINPEGAYYEYLRTSAFPAWTLKTLGAYESGTYRVSVYLHTVTPSSGACTSDVNVAWKYNETIKTKTIVAGHSHAVDETASDGSVFTWVNGGAAGGTITAAVTLTGTCTNVQYAFKLTLERVHIN